jgi:hypothetical protein
MKGSPAGRRWCFFQKDCGSRLNADREIAGKTIRVNGKPRTVVGVMPASFLFPDIMGQELHKGLWLPIQPTTEMQKDRGSHFFYIVARLKPGVVMAQAKAELAAIAPIHPSN